MMRRFARRPLLIISSLCVCLGMSLLGYATYANDQEDAEDTGFVRDYLPLISVLFIAVSYQLGLGPVGWSYLCKTKLQYRSDFLEHLQCRFPHRVFCPMKSDFYCIFLMYKSFFNFIFQLNYSLWI